MRIRPMATASAGALLEVSMNVLKMRMDYAKRK